MGQQFGSAKITLSGHTVELLPSDRLTRRRRKDWVEARRVLAILEKYWAARRELLKHTLSHVRSIAAAHYSGDVAALALICPNGVVVRYESGDHRGAAIGTCPLSLAELVRAASLDSHAAPGS